MKRYNLNLTLIFLLLTFSFFSNQSSAKPCIGEDFVQWNDCQGSYKWEDGAQYSGHWQNGNLNGYGTYIFADDNVWSVKTYEGFYKDDDMHGFGKLTWLDGGHYEGDFFNNDPHGYGVHEYASGNRYEGHYLNGRPHGEGRYTWKDGSYYSGSWRNGDFDGFGVYSYLNGDLYEGNFKFDLKHGFGKMIYKDGSIFEGEWIRDERVEPISKAANEINNKESIEQCPSDESVKWDNCFGDYEYGHGIRHIGSWVNNEGHGEGAQYFPNGEKLRGNFENGLLEGEGKYYFNSGEVYEGSFKNSLMHGEGEITHSDGSIIKARWFQGDIVNISIQFINDNSEKPIDIDQEYVTYCPNKPKVLWNNCFGSGNISDDVKYKGTWRENLPDGFGETYHENELEYQGGFKGGLFHGRGRLFLSSNLQFDGEFKNGIKQGKGIITRTESETQVFGQWVNGRVEGELIVIDENGYKEFIPYEYDEDIFQNVASTMMTERGYE